jgi:hypothetical protein
VAALQSDPIEKKPFFHVFPGSHALTFGMLGCDFHCGYCFPGDTVVITDHGPKTLEECFLTCEQVEVGPDAEIGRPDGLQAITAGESKARAGGFKACLSGRIGRRPALPCRPCDAPRTTESSRRWTLHACQP